jgi:DMSO/TMAO reductase YedYZ molybdopterin-dependent catalytic subunit
MRHAAWLAGLLLASLAAAAAQEAVTTPAPTLAIAGRVAYPRTVTLAELQAMPAATVEVATTTSAGVQRVTYTGPLLWTLVQAAQSVDEPGSGNTALQHTFLARGQDGYAVALSIGEIDPRMEGKQVVVANARDGQPMATLRLVVPGDLHAARSVRDLVAIEVR